MQCLLRHVRTVRQVQASAKNAQVYWSGVRSLATVKELFPEKTDFPSRHIGPRKTDVVSMLDLLGYKVDTALSESQFQ